MSTSSNMTTGYFEGLEPDEVKQLPRGPRRRNLSLALTMSDLLEFGILEELDQCGEDAELLKTVKLNKAQRLIMTVFKLEARRQITDVTRCGTGFDVTYNLRTIGRMVIVHFDREAIEGTVPKIFCRVAVKCHLKKTHRRFLQDLEADNEEDGGDKQEV